LRLGRHVWVARRAWVLPIVTVGEGAIVAAATVVTKHVEGFSVCAGVPGRIVRREVSWCRDPEEIGPEEIAYAADAGDAAE